MNNFIYGSFDAAEHGLIVLDKEIYNAPERDVEFISVPGRNGDIVVDKGRFKNASVTYHCIMTEGFSSEFQAVKNDLKLMTGYQRLEDTFNTDEYRMALMYDTIEPRIKPYNEAAKFDIVFRCKPQRFLKEGSEPVGFALVSAGGIDPSTGANTEDEFSYRMEYMPVEPGTEFNVSAKYQDTTNAALLVAWYDSSKGFISSEDALERNMYISDWEQGDIGSSSGKDNASTARCRTADALNFDGAVGDVSVTIASGYRLYSREYSGYPCTQSNYVGQVWSGAKTLSATFTPTDGHYYRFVVTRDEYSVLDPSDVESTAIMLHARMPGGDTLLISADVPSGAAYARVMYGQGSSGYIGATGVTVDNNGVETHYGDGGVMLINPTGFEAQPIVYLTVSGAASLTYQHISPDNFITNTVVAISDFTSTGRNDIVIDSVIGDCYSEYMGVFPIVASLNNYVTITEGGQYADFPTLQAGRTIINTPSGVTSIKVKAGWWTV